VKTRPKIDHSQFDQALLRRLNAGDTIEQCAKFLGCSHSKVGSRRKANGWYDQQKHESGKIGFEKWQAKGTDPRKD